ncbi:hypothetical protein C1645_819753 [Glomus cerebriforme]|uniref:Uncharacterized protein n=1 Tax=Glomus cerebriforme TaxID=658196 RepID=A0A397T431_9GLOM|nr:hypothetical protein C1645_819753 [Glomus cerebriforme]
MDVHISSVEGKGLTAIYGSGNQTSELEFCLGYNSIDVEFDADTKSQPLQNLNSTIQNPSSIQHQDVIHNSSRQI